MSIFGLKINIQQIIMVKNNFHQEIELKNQDTLNFLLNEDFDIIYITSSDCYIPPKFYGILEDFKKMVLYYYPNLIDYKNQTSHGTMVYTSNYFSNYKGVK